MTINSTQPMVSVVIPHYGGKDILYECILSLKNNTYTNLEIIVVDNDSPDYSAQLIKDNFPEINLLYKSKFNKDLCIFLIGIFKFSLSSSIIE